MRWLLAVLLAVSPLMVGAQDLGGLARVDPTESRIVDVRRGLELTLYLSQPVPYRVFTLDDPRRVVLDFREADWRGVTQARLDQAEGAVDVRFGPLRPGWSRLVIGLDRPMAVETAGLTVRAADGTAQLILRMTDTLAEAFAEAAGAPDAPLWDIETTFEVPQAPEATSDTFVVVLDPGHGGIDPGAERDGLVEAELMLQIASALAEAINRTEGMQAVMTRDADVFVPLDARVSLARAAGADVLISLHADALEGAQATGLSVYTLSAAAVDSAARRMAERHEAGDILAGVDLSGADDRVAAVLMELARLETGPAAARLAETLVIALADAGVELNSRPRREGQFAVLSAADFPSILIELGFLSQADDRARLSDPEARRRMVAGIVQGLERWRLSEEIRAPLVRQ